MRTALLVGIAMVAMAAAACSGAFVVFSGPEDAEDLAQPASQGLVSAVSSDPAAESPVKPEARKHGCRKSAPEGEPGVSVRRSMQTSTGTREYLVYRPAGPASDTPLPLVLNFHGRGSDAVTQERYSGLIPVAERVGFMVVSPEGTGSPRAWSAGATVGSEVDDVAFVSQLLDTLDAESCIDGARIYVTGFSNGAFMASKAACKLGNRIAALAAVAGVAFSGEACVRPMPTIALHGTKDTFVPFDKGMVRQFQYGGARAELKGWAGQNGCTATVMTEKLSANVTRESYMSGQAPVVLYVFNGGGHTWPGAPDIPGLGITNREVNAAETIWAFFSSYRRAA